MTGFSSKRLLYRYIWNALCIYIRGTKFFFNAARARYFKYPGFRYLLGYVKYNFLESECVCNLNTLFRGAILSFEISAI